MGRASSVPLILLGIGFFFVTYDLLATIINYSSATKLVDDYSDGIFLSNHIVEMPKNV